MTIATLSVLIAVLVNRSYECWSFLIDPVAVVKTLPPTFSAPSQVWRRAFFFLYTPYSTTGPRVPDSHSCAHSMVVLRRLLFSRVVPLEGAAARRDRLRGEHEHPPRRRIPTADRGVRSVQPVLRTQSRPQTRRALEGQRGGCYIEDRRRREQTLPTEHMVLFPISRPCSVRGSFPVSLFLAVRRRAPFRRDAAQARSRTPPPARDQPQQHGHRNNILIGRWLHRRAASRATAGRDSRRCPRCPRDCRPPPPWPDRC